MKNQKPFHFSLFSWLSILIVLSLLAACDIPGSANMSLAATQQAMVFQQTQMGFASLTRKRLLDGFKVSDKRLAVLPGDVLQAIADLVDDAALDLDLREHRQDGLFETG